MKRAMETEIKPEKEAKRARREVLFVETDAITPTGPLVWRRGEGAMESSTLVLVTGAIATMIINAGGEDVLRPPTTEPAPAPSIEEISSGPVDDEDDEDDDDKDFEAGEAADDSVSGVEFASSSADPSEGDEEEEEDAEDEEGEEGEADDEPEDDEPEDDDEPDDDSLFGGSCMDDPAIVTSLLQVNLGDYADKKAFLAAMNKARHQYDSQGDARLFVALVLVAAGNRSKNLVAHIGADVVAEAETVQFEAYFHGPGAVPLIHGETGVMWHRDDVFD